MSDAADPFATPAELRDPVRRLRGRLTAPVTVWTSGDVDGRAGLTISSILMAEGDPAYVFGLVNSLTDLWDSVQVRETFVVHVLGGAHRRVAERFAGRTPVPGGPWHGLAAGDSPWGPTISDVGNRAYCRLADADEVGFYQLVRGRIEAVDVDDLDDPLSYFQGRYRSLRPRNPGSI
jgi:3-hydroxy-9,10-secoandrosta-1,3,5(10)-triene-9,17-dione monooxygenase reductase component